MLPSHTIQKNADRRFWTFMFDYKPDVKARELVPRRQKVGRVEERGRMRPRAGQCGTDQHRAQSSLSGSAPRTAAATPGVDVRGPSHGWRVHPRVRETHRAAIKYKNKVLNAKLQCLALLVGTLGIQVLC